MALFSKRNIDKAKALADKNKDKIADTVTKATGAIDKKTGGKHADKLKKVDDAVKKYAVVTDTEAAGESAEPGTGASDADD